MKKEAKERTSKSEKGIRKKRMGKVSGRNHNKNMSKTINKATNNVICLFV